jgi:cytochrome P450
VCVRRIFHVGTPFTRIWHDMEFLNGSLQSKTTLPETKSRREFLAPFFSKVAILRSEPYLHRQKMTKFLTTLDQAHGTVVDFFLAFRCLTADLIMDYCFQSDVDALGTPGFKSNMIEKFGEGTDMALVPMYFPTFFSFVNKLVSLLPAHVQEEKFPAIHGFKTMQSVARDRIEYLTHNPEKTDSKIPTMFDLMLNPDAAKGQVTPPKSDMVADGTLMIVAGTDTTANTLGTILFHVTQDPSVHAKLFEELKTNIVNPDTVLDSASLEGPAFPYTRAVVKEGLRLSYGVPGRIIRKTPAEGATFNGRFVPGGTVVTSGIYLQNTDPNTFPEPFTFDPERWLCDAETYKLRDKQMQSFSRGSRGCIGINLAYATLNLTVAHLFRRFEVQTLGYTTEADMEWHDCFIPAPKNHIKGLLKRREV